MPAPNLQDNRRKEDSLNPAQNDFEQKFNDSLGQGDVTKGIQDLENFANQNDSKKVEDAKKPVDEQEEGADWKNNTSQDPAVPVGGIKGKILSKGLGIAKKRGGIIGLLAAILVGGGVLAGFFGPASMVINLMENFTDTNDSMTVSMERRLLKVLGFSTTDPNPSDPICANNSKLTLRCKMGSISSSALKQLEKKGLVPYYNNNEAVDTSKRYPTRNPDGYMYDAGDGKGPIRIESRNLTEHLAKNPKMAVKILGPGGAFSVNKAWMGKQITKRFFSVFGLDKKGGLLDGTTKLSGNAQERIKQTMDRMKKKLPGATAASEAKAKVMTKIQGQLGKAKKGGVGYMLAVGGCMAPKAPGIFAATAAGIELLPVLAFASDFVLSPGGKLKSAGIEGSSSVSPEEVSALNTTLTNKSLDKDSNKMLAVPDSEIALAAAGINKGKPKVPTSAPGFGLLNSPFVVNANKINKATEPACNVIMSPAAMWSAFAVDTAVTVAASSTVVLGIVKVVIGLGASLAVEYIVGQVAGAIAQDVLTEVLQNRELGDAQGKALGDVIGLGAMAYFASAAMSRSVPGLKMSQLKSFSAVKAESQDFEKQMAVASLSPFDTSSKYTFLGSIIHNVNTAMLANGGYNGNIFSVLSSIASIPNTFINPTVGAAAEFTENYCGYAADFGLEVKDVNGQPDPENTPAINAAGLPCTGLTTEQASMSPQEAINLMISEGWIDESKSINPNDTIEDLQTNGVIKSDTPLSEFIESCSSAETGDYLFNAAGCTTQSATKSTAGVQDGYKAEDQCSVNNDGETVCMNDMAELDESSGAATTSNGRSLTAISVFLLDYQANAMINGQDEATGSSSNVISTGEYVLPLDPGYSPPGPNTDWGSRSCRGCSDFHRALDLTDFPDFSKGKPIYAIADGEVIAVGRSNGSGTTCTGGGVGSNNTLKIKHANGTISGYWHSAPGDHKVNVGDRVTAGQHITAINNCGQSYGAHLHFTIERGDTTDERILAIEESGGFINPGPYMALFGVDVLNGKYTDGR